MTEEKWKVLPSGIPGLFDVYDQDGNHVVRHKTKERADLIAAAPELLAACKALVIQFEAYQKDWLGTWVDRIGLPVDLFWARDAIAQALGKGDD